MNNANRVIVSTSFLMLLLGSALHCVAQNTKGEKEFRAFLAEYEKAVSGRNIDFVERATPEDYVRTGADGKLTDRSRLLKYLRQQRDKPTFRYVSLQHLNMKVRVVGSMALVTNDWIAVTLSIEETSPEPSTDKGRYTGVFEKRKGRWMVLAEHDSEQIHDDEWIVSSVRKAGREYNDLMKRLKSGRPYAELESSGDLEVLRRTLADEYTYTSDDGELFSKAQDLVGYKTNQIKIDSAVFLEQNVRSIDNNAAIETGKIRYIGTNAGNAFDITKRYTTTWAFYDGRWQITADHTSAVKQ
ncbi:MAG TPA: nuclear transport factor 2 family protein [Pyrinomonadaceae bacterium]|nr:nuclear transport factor 2 family protein [Pyrinomonadaceae bacterium]